MEFLHANRKGLYAAGLSLLTLYGAFLILHLWVPGQVTLNKPVLLSESAKLLAGFTFGLLPPMIANWIEADRRKQQLRAACVAGLQQLAVHEKSFEELTNSDSSVFSSGEQQEDIVVIQRKRQVFNAALSTASKASLDCLYYINDKALDSAVSKPARDTLTGFLAFSSHHANDASSATAENLKTSAGQILSLLKEGLRNEA